MSELKDIVPPLELCKKAEARFPEAWKHDFCRDEWHQTALCWRTFNRGRKDEYCIVFFTGALDPKFTDDWYGPGFAGGCRQRSRG